MTVAGAAERRHGDVRLTTAYWAADTSLEVRNVTVGDLLRSAATDAPDTTALVAAGPDAGDRRRWSYAQLLGEAERAAYALAERFTPGERLAVWADNVPEWVFVQFGAAMAGLVLVTVNPALRPREAEYVLRQSGAAAVVAVDEFRGASPFAMANEMAEGLPNLREVVSVSRWQDFVDSSRQTELPRVGPNDPVMIQYTSGTTGSPKGALLSHRGVVNMSYLLGVRMEVEEGTAWLNYMPMFHTGGCVFTGLGAPWKRSTHVLMRTFDAGMALRLIEDERCNYMASVPTMLIAMLEHAEVKRRNLSSLVAAATGGSPVAAELVRRVERELSVRLHVVFGQTELSGCTTMSYATDSPEAKAETSGRPLGQTELKIVDPRHGGICAIDEQGEICVRGVGQMLEYYQMPEATAETIDADGWLHTGDLGSLTREGNLRVTGRIKEMIIRGGENLFPAEIEQAVFEHPAVAEVAVVGVPDPTWGEEVVAFVRIVNGATVTEDELTDFVLQRISRHKRPRRWIFADAMPLTASGKIQKFVLRDSLLRSP